MKNLLLATVFILAAAAANPYMPTLVNEFGQDEHRGPWIELHPRPFEEDLDLRGWLIKTSTSTCTLDCELNPWFQFVVISESTRWDYWRGTLALDPDSDFIAVYNPNNTQWPDSEIVRYPVWPPGYGGAPAPPLGNSAAFWNYDDAGGQSFNWYVDSTPTRGQINDDYSSIAGVVRGSNGESPMDCFVYCRGPNGRLHQYQWRTGVYRVDGLGPGTYQVTAEARFGNVRYNVAYPESVELGYSTVVESINIVVTLTGVNEADARGADSPELRVHGSTVSLVSPGEVQADVKLLDALGRSVASLYSGTTPAGRRDLALPPDLSSGTYFVRLTWPGGNQQAPLVLSR